MTPQRGSRGPCLAAAAMLKSLIIFEPTRWQVFFPFPFCSTPLTIINTFRPQDLQTLTGHLSHYTLVTSASTTLTTFSITDKMPFKDGTWSRWPPSHVLLHPGSQAAFLAFGRGHSNAFGLCHLTGHEPFRFPSFCVDRAARRAAASS